MVLKLNINYIRTLPVKKKWHTALGKDYGRTSSLEIRCDILANIAGILHSEVIVGALETSPRWICAMEELRERRYSLDTAEE